MQVWFCMDLEPQHLVDGMRCNKYDLTEGLGVKFTAHHRNWVLYLRWPRFYTFGPVQGGHWLVPLLARLYRPLSSYKSPLRHCFTHLLLKHCFCSFCSILCCQKCPKFGSLFDFKTKSSKVLELWCNGCYCVFSFICLCTGFSVITRGIYSAFIQPYDAQW